MINDRKETALAAGRCQRDKIWLA
ncbi:hypothetical protein MED193_07079 [Roseobacter sp. MED193]|nr:hypothetical protein MED193_07079 [Roseobacter sp. MED193]